NCDFIDYCLVGVNNPKPHYIFIFEFKDKNTPKDYTLFLKDIDLKLQELNNIYYFNIAGPNKGTLTSPELWVLKKNGFIEVNNRKINEFDNIGQSKINRYSTDSTILKYFDDLIISKYYLE
ncbi:MAG: hypothetical protein ACTSWR_05350, partial [Candidatus Helarchaeota archaeon]